MVESSTGTGTPLLNLKEDVIYQPDDSSIYTSTHFNLKQICPKLLEHKYSYLKYHSDLYLFNDNEHVLKDLSKIPLYSDDTGNESLSQNLLTFSNYLAYNIFISYLRESYVVLKDMEQYYNSQMMLYLKKVNYLKDIPLSIIASYWSMITRTLSFLKDKVKSYEYYFPLYDIYYSDNEHNFKDTIPLVGVNKDNTISLTYFMMMKDSSSFITGSYLDLIRVPSLCKVLLFFYKNGIQIRDINIIWFPSGNTLKFNKFVSAKYKNIHNPDLVQYIHNKYEINRKTSHTVDLYKCTFCPFWDKCTQNNHFLELRTSDIQVL